MGEPRAARTGLIAALAALALAACVPLSPPPYATPTPVAASSAASSGDGFTHAERITLRVWATTCDSYRNGTAWMLDRTHAVTNRHVVKGATDLELTDYQGRHYHATTAAYSTSDDLALITIDGTFPDAATIATDEPSPGDDLTVTGYALGGPLASVTGPYVGLRDDELDPGGPQIYYLRVLAKEGNSGSPVTDAAGDVVGVVFSSDSHEYAGAVTLPRLEAFLADEARLTEVRAAC
ncbi:trypsin-like peptidase domain-containing protein [Demequina soli]|uniref:trypsin-like peptidase domain-containing protein n=1 Tax=Demequina soli TaxID=1638987 RepID=UPI0007812E3D|nr:trypsin-like peptidase domain-containing protein [Demequina soli]